jgi:hypothetical protein
MSATKAAKTANATTTSTIKEKKTKAKAAKAKAAKAKHRRTDSWGFSTSCSGGNSCNCENIEEFGEEFGEEFYSRNSTIISEFGSMFATCDLVPSYISDKANMIATCHKMIAQGYEFSAALLKWIDWFYLGATSSQRPMCAISPLRCKQLIFLHKKNIIYNIYSI